MQFVAEIARDEVLISVMYKKASNHHANLPLEKYSFSTRALIKVSGHQHQWFPGVSQVVTM